MTCSTKYDNNAYTETHTHNVQRDTASLQRINRNHNAIICFCSNTGGLFMFYLQQQEDGTIPELVASTLWKLVVKKTICTSVSIWIMGKHVITSPRRLGIHPVLVFKLIPQMPSAWHFCEEAGTPSSSHCWNPSQGAEQAQSWFFFPPAHMGFFLHSSTVPVSAHPPKVSFSLFTERPEASGD